MSDMTLFEAYEELFRYSNEIWPQGVFLEHGDWRVKRSRAVRIALNALREKMIIDELHDRDIERFEIESED